MTQEEKGMMKLMCAMAWDEMNTEMQVQCIDLIQIVHSLMDVGEINDMQHQFLYKHYFGNTNVPAVSLLETLKEQMKKTLKTLEI